MIRTPSAVALTLLACSALVSPLHAQIVSPPIDRHAVEFGLAYKWYDRNLDSGPISEVKWEVATFYGRYGAFNRVTLSAEGGVWDVEHEDFVSTYRRYTMGGGIAVLLFERTSWQLAASAHYQTVWDNDVSSLNFDKRTYGVNVDALAAYRFDIAGQETRVWAGPTFVNDVAENYLWGSEEPTTHDPAQNWGLVVGGEAVLWKHVSGLAHAVFLDNPQWWTGVAWRIGGEP